MRASLVMIAALLAGCDEDRVVSEAGRFELRFAGLRSEPLVAWAAPYRVVAGSRLCPEVRCAACEADDACADVTVSASGPVQADAGCFVAEAPGEVRWQVGAPCDESDRARIEVVAPTRVAAALALWPDRLVEADAAASLGAGFSGALPDPLRVIEGAQVRLPVRLHTPEDGRVVAWSEGQVSVEPTTGRAPVVYPGESLELVGFAGGAAALTFSVGGSTWPLGQVVGVPASDAEALALAVALAPGEGGAAPIVARARVSDAQGRGLLGAQPTWSVTAGELALALDASLPGPDYVRIDDVCVAPEARGGPRSAEISAQYEGMTARVELRWDGVAEPRDPAWTRPEQCPEAGCGCRSQAGGGWVTLVLLGWRRRGRR